MTTVLIATSPDELQQLLTWARWIAVGRDEPLHILLPQRRSGPVQLKQAADQPQESDSELLTAARQRLAEALPIPAQTAAEVTEQPVTIWQLRGEDWQSQLAEQLEELDPQFVVLPAPTATRDSQSTQWQLQLLDHVECDLLLVRDDAVAFDDEPHVGVFVGPAFDNEAALNFSIALTSATGGKRTAIYVEPFVGDLAATIGRRQLADLLRRTIRRDDVASFGQEVALAGHPAESFDQIPVHSFDLLIVGSSDRRDLQRMFRASPVVDAEQNVPAIAVLKPGQSLGSRLSNRFDRWIRSVVPQLSREDRVGLVGRIQTSSQWDFDFILLVSLSTLIACLGLAENSVAVIVGAMLVAPLMTPIAGVGLGIAHANLFLTRTAFRTAIRGFATALLIGIVFGLVVQCVVWCGWLKPLQNADSLLFPGEMEGRMRPQFYDLLIALASGVAAAYAMGRPNLFSALPGVAIAAALVPPIAVSGIAFAHGEVVRGGGALLLFATNMVTIILGTSLVFRAVGIRSQKEGANAARWPRYVLLFLVLLSFLLTVMIEMRPKTFSAGPGRIDTMYIR